jgi:RNA polymerase sigma factor (sigma-70 family)
LREGDLSALSRHIRTAVSGISSAESTDHQLVLRFATARDEAAFAVLVGRYGRLVQNVCRNVLGDEHDAEEAAQATFLVLARRASSLHGLEVLAGWLHGVAYRTALRARRDASRRLAREARERPVRAVSPPGPIAEVSLRELQAILDEELQRLPERLRTPFILCCLEGYGHREAARRLGWKTSTVSSRLHEARELLRRLLARRGVSLSAVLGGLVVADGKARAGLPAVRAAETAAAARRYVDGAALEPTEKLAGAVLRQALWSKAKAALIAVAVTGTLLIGLGIRLRRAEAPSPVPEPIAANLPALAVADPPRLDRFGDPLPADAIARLGTARFGHDWHTESAIWSPDGKVIASLGVGIGGWPRPLCLWDAATGRELHQLAAEQPVPAAAFSPDGKTLAAAEGKRGIVLWDVRTGKELRHFTDQGYGRAVAYAPDGRTVAAAYSRGNPRVVARSVVYDSVIQVREVMTGRLVVELKPRGEMIQSLAYAPDGKTLASKGSDGAIVLWDLATGTERWREKAIVRGPSALALSPDGKTLASNELAAFNEVASAVQVRETASGRSVRAFGKTSASSPIAYSSDGQTLALGIGEFVCLWELSTGKERRRWPVGSSHLTSLSYSPDGRTLATTSYMRSRVQLWDPETGAELRPVFGHNAFVYRLSFAPDGKALWSAARDATVICWDLASGTGRQLPGVHADGFFHPAAFSDDGKLVATASQDGSVRLWDAGGRALATLTGGGQVSVALSPGGKVLASTDGRSVRFWDVATRRELRQIKVPPTGNRCGCLALSPDGRRLAAATGYPAGQGPVRVLDVPTGEEILRLPSRDVPVTYASPDGTFRPPAPSVPATHEQFVCFSPDGRTLATIGHCQDSIVRLWDAATGKLIGRCGGATDCTEWYCLAFSPDGRLLATGPFERDDTVHIWEVATRQEVGRLRGHRGGVTALAFSPDGRSLASGGGDATVLIWDLTGRTNSGQRLADRLSPSQLEECWSNLRGEDAPAAYRAVRALAADPVRSVPFLAERLRSTQLADPTEPARLAEDLAPTREWLRQRRAVMALEYAATPEALEILQALAGAQVETALAGEARAALVRSRSGP